MSNEEPAFPKDEIIPFYDHTGTPLFYLYSNGEHFYHYDGTPLAYLHDGEFIVSYSGEYLGWIYNA